MDTIITAVCFDFSRKLSWNQIASVQYIGPLKDNNFKVDIYYAFSIVTLAFVNVNILHCSDSLQSTTGHFGPIQ